MGYKSDKIIQDGDDRYVPYEKIKNKVKKDKTWKKKIKPWQRRRP